MVIGSVFYYANVFAVLCSWDEGRDVIAKMLLLSNRNLGPRHRYSPLLRHKNSLNVYNVYISMFMVCHQANKADEIPVLFYLVFGDYMNDKINLKSVSLISPVLNAESSSMFTLCASSS